MKHSLRRGLLAVALATAALLLVPLAAMQLTGEVDWGWGDFVLAAALLFSAGSAVVLALSFPKRPLPRATAILSIALLFAAVWAGLAVGLFD